jgi:hypothetical protein
MIVDRRFRLSVMMEAVRTTEASVDNHITLQYNPEDSSEDRTGILFKMLSSQLAARAFPNKRTDKCI